MWRIEFTSDRFLPALPEACQANPGAYGFELAWWLARALAARGVPTSYPLGEDWGWLIERSDEQEREFSIGCASIAEEGEGYAGKPLRWSVFVRPYRSLRQRIQGVDHGEQVQALARHITAVLQAEGIAVEQVEG